LRGHYLAVVAGQIGFGYRRLLGAASMSDALLDARFGHREAVLTDLRWCPALLALFLLVLRFAPEFASARRRVAGRRANSSYV
jgi:mxaL protein